MIETMIEYRGVGLAAPQVHEGLRLFVAALDADNGGEPKGEPAIIINPDIVRIGREVVEGWEGCLSVPDIRGQVPRAREVTVRGFDRHAEPLELEAHDFSARVIQHEADHLDGILFFDRMRSVVSLTFLDEYARYWAKD
jgi:peptide deformylase